MAEAGRRVVPMQGQCALPAWITQASAWAKLPRSVRTTMARAAEAGDIEPDGSIVGIFGGQPLAELCGVSIRTFWRHVKRLEAEGFILLLSRGGRINGREIGDVWGVPGSAGALDGRRQRRELRRMVRGEDGRWRPEVIRPGAQPTLWAESDTAPRAKVTRPPVPDDTAPPCQSDTLSSYEKIQKKDHDVSPRREKREARRWLKVRAECTERMEPLAELYFECVSKGFITQGQASWLRLVTAAAHARRKADDPPALLAWMIRGARYVCLTDQDEENAIRWMKQAGMYPLP